MRNRCGFHIDLLGFLCLALLAPACLLASQPASQPASPLTATQQQLLDEIIRDLQTLKADAKTLPAIQAHLETERTRLASELKAGESQLRQLRSQIEAISLKQTELASRLRAIQAGQTLLAVKPPDGNAPPPTSPQLAAVPASQPAQAAQTIKPEMKFFVEQVRPVLASQCLNCHGGKFTKGGLNLSTREGLVRGGDTGPAIVPGKSKESLLYKLITHAEDPHMPAKADKLPDETIERIARWIDAGAPYDAPLTPTGAAAAPAGDAHPTQHWAFKPPVRSALPAVKQGGWVRNPIDAFVLARLEASGLAPSREADRGTLIRRLSLDLLGMLPKPSEVEEFVADPRPDAYERLVDRLLASPHYGERWGRHWLDLARYADSDGYEKDTARPNAWRWRDWLIDAINRDLPFDEFTVEQLAGDLLPRATLEQRVATGFHRNTLTNKEGGVDQEEYRVKAVVDRTNTTGTVWLGLTVGCAQCHTHKYDPISNREYYQMFAFFNTAQEVDSPAPLPAEAETYQKAKAAFDEAHARLTAAVAAFEKDKFPARLAEWEQRTASEKETEWTVLRPVLASSSGGATLTVGTDGTVLASGKNPETDSYVLVLKTDLVGITALKIEPLSDASLPGKGPGRMVGGNFVLSEVRLSTSDPADPSTLAMPDVVRFGRAEADHEQKDGPWTAQATIDGDPKTGWAIGPQFGKHHALILETAQSVGKPGGTLLTLVLDHNYGYQHAIGKLRISATTAARPVRLKSMPADIRQIVKMPAGQRSPEQRAKLAEYYKPLDKELTGLTRAVDEHAKKAPPVPMGQMLVESAKPPNTHILMKGDFLRPGDEVHPATLAVLHPFKARGPKPDRLDLARWLVDPSNPLTPRVTVNRMWHHLFGQGFVTSLDDFGVRSDPPSHPELLDWLATELIQRGWSRKAMIKLMVTSATYRQSSSVSPGLLERDPKNVLLARQSRFRAEAEIVRDITLQAGGLLNEAIGGPSIRPPLPRDLAALVYANSLKWNESPGIEKYRRGMYIHFQRTVPFPMLMAFDEPDSNVTCPRRERSNTPLQSLTLLNDGEFFQCAQKLGVQALKLTAPPVQAQVIPNTPQIRLVAQGGEEPKLSGRSDPSLEAGIGLIYRVCLSREPAPFETARLSQLWHEIGALSAKDAKIASQMVGTPEIKLAAAQLPQAAAWVAVARTVMNLDEFVTRE